MSVSGKKCQFFLNDDIQFKLKFHEFYNIQRQKIPERIRISLENHSSSTENSKNPSFSTENL